MTRYRLFGFTLDSDVRFPELEVDDRAPALWLRTGGRIDASIREITIRVIETEDGEPWLTLTRTSGGFLLEFHERLVVHYRSPQAWITRAPALGDDSFRHLVLDQALPMIVSQEGQTVLHGACAIRDNQAVLFAGPAGSGKSTLVARLLENGWTAAADDAAAVEIVGPEVLVQPSYSGLRLWPDSAEALGLGAGSVVADDSDKRRFTTGSLPRHGIPLGAVYVIDGGRARDAAVRAFSRRDAVMALVRNAYVLDIADRVQARARLESLAQVASRVPVYQLTLPHRYEALGLVTSLVTRDLAAGARA
jgi:hypothetical protein